MDTPHQVKSEDFDSCCLYPPLQNIREVQPSLRGAAAPRRQWLQASAPSPGRRFTVLDGGDLVRQKVSKRIALACAEHAWRVGEATRPRPDDVMALIESCMYNAEYEDEAGH